MTPPPVKRALRSLNSLFLDIRHRTVTYPEDQTIDSPRSQPTFFKKNKANSTGNRVQLLSMKKPPLKFKTIFISDVHLGTLNSKAKEVLHFLKNTRCDRLVLNGDIIDGWQLGRGSKWTKEHTRFVRYVLEQVEKKELEVIYLRGNHDDILSRFLPMQFASVSIVEDYVHETPSGRYLVLHGDVFDTVTKNFTFLAHLGDWGYRILMGINRQYNSYRAWRGKEYYSLSKAIKAKVKKAVNFISDFEEKLAKLAESRGCIGVICGHIHTPADKRYGNLHYLNSGDWVESLSAIVEHFDGQMQLLHFRDFVQTYPFDTDKPQEEDSLSAGNQAASNTSPGSAPSA